ncbi:hypothetical protein T484DRAFT_1624802, partial [Baffinella frigidus]
TLHPAPCTLHPKPQSPNPKPQTLNPKPQTSTHGERTAAVVWQEPDCIPPPLQGQEGFHQPSSWSQIALFCPSDLYWKSPKSGDLWCTLVVSTERICSP